MENAQRVRDIYLETKPVTNRFLTSRYQKNGITHQRPSLKLANQYAHYFHENIQNNITKNREHVKSKGKTNQKISFIETSTLQQQNRNLKMKVKELQQLMDQNHRQIQLNQNNPISHFDSNHQMLKLLQNFSKQVEELEKKRLYQLKKQKENINRSQNSTEQWCTNWRTDGQLDQDVDISPKSIILAAIMEFSEMYKKIPEKDANNELSEIYTANQQMFVAIINNKIRLNQLLGIN